MNNEMKERLYCPICGQEHDIDIIKKKVAVTVKNQNVECMQVFYRCGNTADDNEFVNGKMLNENLLAVKDAYRKQCGLSTSD